jgi:hypothetical protein
MSEKWYTCAETGEAICDDSTIAKKNSVSKEGLKIEYGSVGARMPYPRR